MTSAACADSSALIDYLKGSDGDDMRLLDDLLASRQVVIAPVVLTELLSSSRLTPEAEEFLVALPSPPPSDGYWIRAGRLRRTLLKAGERAALADTLIAQYCLDHELPLLTRDLDFDGISRHCRLKLLRPR